MKKRIFSLLLALVIISICGCTPANEKSGKNEEPGTEIGDDENIDQVELVADSFSVSDKIELALTIKNPPEDLDGTVKVEAKAENGKKVSGVFKTSEKIELNSPASSGIITVTAVLSDNSGRELDEMMLKTKDGLIQLTEDSAALVVAEMTDEEKAHLVAGTGEPKKVGASGGTYEIERLGVPSITVNDGPAGVRYNTSVWYPSVMNMTSSWDEELIRKVGAAMGGDSLALGIDIVLAPGMNIQKNVLGGRNFEYCAEDPLLTAFSATAYVKGMQSAGAGACLKHFVANEQETDRGTISSNMTERALREIYLKPFQLAVKYSSPVSIMSSYNKLNGTYNSINKDLLTGILRDEWNYKGMVMCDWGAAGAIEEKVSAQNDIKMPGGEANNVPDVLAGLKSGRVDKAALDKCCEHILYAITQSPTFKNLKMNFEVDLAGHGKVAQEAAADTIVLLKNENGALPLASGTSVALFGNGAYKTVFGGSGSGGVTPASTVSIKKGIDNNGKLSVYDEKNNIFRRAAAHSKTDPSQDKIVEEDYAKACAEGAGTAVIVISRDSMEGADNSVSKGDFMLNGNESNMIRRVSEAFHAQGKKVTVLINTGSPIEISSWQELVDAVLFIGYPGQNAGDAVAAVLSGDVNPSAKTTMSWPVSYTDTPEYSSFPGSPSKIVYYEDIYVGYRYYNTFDVKTAYPFGHGLSYTEFEYSDFNVKENQNGSFTASVKITNKGGRAGREIVQIYVSKPETTLEQPKYELCGFAKTKLLDPGESETVNVKITDDALFSYDTQNSRYIVDAGQYKFFAAASSNDIHAEASVDINALRVVYDVENRCVPSPEPMHIVKSEYKNRGQITGEDALGSELTKKGKAYTLELGSLSEVGAVYLNWEKLDSPYVVSVAGEDQKFTRYDIFASDGLNFTIINLHGTEAKYIRIEPVTSSKITDAKVFSATEADKADKPEIYENIALNKRVRAASVEGNLVAANAVDGNLTTRWGSDPNGKSWLTVDLGESRQVKGIMLYLEAAYVPYRIEYSNDNKNFTTIASYGSGELFVKLRDLDVEARYIRFIREGENWFSIYEAEIYG